MQDSKQKQFVMDAVEENGNNIALLGDNIFYFRRAGDAGVPYHRSS